MNLKFFRILAILPFLYSCQSSPTETNGPAVVDLNDSITNIQDSININPADLKKAWNEVAAKLPAIDVPSKIECKSINDSLQFELSKLQQVQLIPQEVLKQKEPVISSFANLVVEKDTVGTFYYINYPVVYNKLTDITCQILLVMYNENGQYSDFKTLAINDYGMGYSKIKSSKEIVYLYTAEKEKIETDITIYDVSYKVSISKVNTMHFTSGGSQEEYEKNTQLIEKMMK
jgi:hypothetical protein